jgi:hypothetical protein
MPPSKKKKRGKNPKPEEQEGMPQRQHSVSPAAMRVALLNDGEAMI